MPLNKIFSLKFGYILLVNYLFILLVGSFRTLFYINLLPVSIKNLNFATLNMFFFSSLRCFRNTFASLLFLLFVFFLVHLVYVCFFFYWWCFLRFILFVEINIYILINLLLLKMVIKKSESKKEKENKKKNSRFLVNLDVENTNTINERENWLNNDEYNVDVNKKSSNNKDEKMNRGKRDDAERLMIVCDKKVQREWEKNIKEKGGGNFKINKKVSFYERELEWLVDWYGRQVEKRAEKNITEDKYEMIKGKVDEKFSNAYKYVKKNGDWIVIGKKYVVFCTMIKNHGETHESVSANCRVYEKVDWFKRK